MTLAPASRITNGRLLVPAALTLLGAVCAAALAAAGPERADAKNAKVVGKTKSTPEPSCPKSPCEAVGSVTGFQVRAGDQKNLFRVREDGHLVAWSVDVSRPRKSQREFFGDFYENKSFGTAPSARIAVLKPKDGPRFKLKAQSPAIKLNEHLGEMPIVTLDKPLRIKEGDVVALTVPSWASDFAVGLSEHNVWRASRDAGECTRDRDIKEGKPQQKVDSTRVYACRYETARLLYWGYVA